MRKKGLKKAPREPPGLLQHPSWFSPAWIIWYHPQINIHCIARRQLISDQWYNTAPSMDSWGTQLPISSVERTVHLFLLFVSCHYPTVNPKECLASYPVTAEAHSEVFGRVPCQKPFGRPSPSVCNVFFLHLWPVLPTQNLNPFLPVLFPALWGPTQSAVFLGWQSALLFQILHNIWQLYKHLDFF